MPFIHLFKKNETLESWHNWLFYNTILNLLLNWKCLIFQEMFSSMCFVYKEQFLLEVFQLQSQKCTIKCHFHSVHPPPPALFCWGKVHLQRNFQKGGLDRTSIFRGWLLGKRGVPFFRGGCNFGRNSAKSGIFNDKNVYKQEQFALS